MTFIHLYNRGINLLRNKLGKTLIVGASTTLFLGYDSYKFRKETSPIQCGIYLYPDEDIKYDNSSIYSQIMKPIRTIKDCIWIDEIHEALIKDNTLNDLCQITSKTYRKFLLDFPYPKETYNKEVLNCWYISRKWMFEEIFRLNENSKQYSEEIQNMLTIYSKRKFSPSSSYFAIKLLEIELDKDKLERNNTIITWCFHEAIYCNINILYYLKDEHLLKLNDWIFDPENINSLHSEILKLHRHERILSELTKLNIKSLDYITSYLNKYSNLFESLGMTNDPNYIDIDIYIDSIFQNKILKNIIVNNFNKLYLPIKMTIIYKMIKNNTTENIEDDNKFISDFFKDNNNLTEYIIKYNSIITPQYLYNILSQYTNIENIQSHITNLCVNGIYQFDDSYEIPDYILKDSENIGKLLMNQKNLNDKEINKLILKYEKQNSHLTTIELMMFIKKYQPKLFEKVFN